MTLCDRSGPDIATLMERVIRVLPRDRLVEYAVARHGFENSDIGCGVMYRELGDDPQTAHIPPGHVEIYVGGGAPQGFEAIVTEDDYIAILAATLRAQGEGEAARRVEAFRTQLSTLG